MASKSKFRVLLADDESGIRKTVARSLSRAGYEVVEAIDGEDTKQKLSSDIDIALIDVRMPKASGIECLGFSKENYPETEVILLTAQANLDDALAAVKAGAFWYLAKPFDREELIALVNKACILKQLREDNRDIKYLLEDALCQTKLVGKSRAMQELERKIARLAQLESTVLITGESGTGKTTIAHLVHQLSDRKEKPFVSISCAALPRDLLESELFGHERGAFTGAVQKRLGAFEIANGGTLFLDEIGEIPLELQPKLLTVLQDLKIRRLGSSIEKEVDVRIIAATNQNLQQMCEDKKFRQDLYFRLNVLELDVPPLRARQEDIELLAESYLDSIAEKREMSEFRLTDKAKETLRGYGWPGNIRELENILERATAFAESAELSVADLAIKGPGSKGESPDGDILSLCSLAGMKLEEVEAKALSDTLAQCEGNKSKAARLLGISVKSVYNKIEKYGL